VALHILKAKVVIDDNGRLIYSVAYRETSLSRLFIQIQGMYWILKCKYLKAKFTLQMAAASSRLFSGTGV
jgi:hypothetical protein